MYGTNMGSLEVDIYSNGTWTNNVIPAITGNQGNVWLLGVVDLSAYTGQVINVRFKGTTGNEFESDLALDDINIISTTGIHENISANAVSISPNPSSGLFNLVIRTAKTENVTVSVTDMNGRIISSTVVQVAGVYSSKMDLRNYAKGIYSVVVKSEGSVYRTRVVIL
jgi:hypothetical protein